MWATFYDADGNVLERVNANAVNAPRNTSCQWQRAGGEFVCSLTDGTVQDRRPLHDDRLDCDWGLPRGYLATTSPWIDCVDDAGEVVATTDD